ncbi:hypothetical protein SYNTR_1155 [Candidatus Syntrophocurvum alkaliphilum]|uniref:Uncharacterized protein n=1 Tax=Candidatus Syntrophocurvum alkaliphilum TaxID=2293317 RepID=A0A6I6DA93_9FIRM|nr:hypothetical protein [Candidatus Syntrophocurvum alkaliphilum]QGT99748.1 hypothetical protein SYNTR_1155 [Candidatus Syntrophocurvum alkaliphilum]
MQLLLKITAIFLTILLLILVFWGIASGYFISVDFWILYGIIVLLDFLCINKLKNLQKE